MLEANPQYRKIRFPESTKPAYAALVRSMQTVELPEVFGLDLAKRRQAAEKAPR